MAAETDLAAFLFGRAQTRRSVLSILFAEPGKAVHLRELARRTGFSPTMIGKELGGLLAAGVVTERHEKNLRAFQANLESPMAGEIRRLIGFSPVKSQTPLPEAIPDLATLRATAGRRRPSSLQEAALWGAQLGNRDAFLREFLDEFHTAARQDLSTMLAEEPAIDRDDARANAYYAAVAEHLALQNHLPIPEWTQRRERFLDRPFFPSRLESLKATLLVESPVAFRRRMIFVGADPLSRPRRAAPRASAPTGMHP